MLRKRNKRRTYFAMRRQNSWSVIQSARLTLPFSALTIALCLISYVALTSVTVWNTAARFDNEKEIAKKEALLSELEAKVSVLEDKITPSMAYEKGFTDSKEVKYITAKPLSRVSFINEMEL